MENKQSKKSLIFIITAIILVIIVAILLMNYLGPTIPTIAESEFKSFLEQDRIVGIEMVDNYTARVLLTTLPEGTPEEVLKNDYAKGYTLDEFKKNEKKSDFYVVITSRNSMSDMIDTYYNDLNAKYEQDVENGLEVTKPVKPYLNLNDPNSGTSWSSIISVLSFILIAGLAIIMLVSLRGGKGGGNPAMNFGKNKARLASNVKVRFSDVAGAEEEKEELREIVEFLKHPKRFTAIGAKIPRGVLLVGPPGTGKTLFAKAVAGEANVPFFSISGSDFVEMFVGVGASRVRDLFAQAKKNMPCIVFIDEIDAVGRQRGAGMGGGNDEREQTLNQLLVQMDGFDTNEGIIIMAATNRVDILDPALLRPGRFDRQVYVNSPDVKGREAIFKVHSRNKPISPEVDFQNLARLTSGFSGADIANLLNEAAILAARNNRQTILMKDILEGINKVIAGPQKRSRVTTEIDKRITAYHEAGHAIVGYLMKHCDGVQEVSIIPRGIAAGYTISLPKNDNNHVTINKLNDEIAMMLGGRASEETIIQDISTGASNDIKRATAIARKMVCEWGMSDKLPNLFFGGDQEVFIGRDYQTQTTYGDKVAGIIDDEIKKIIDHNYARALEVIKANRTVLDNMVKLLYVRDTIYGDEVDMLMQGKTLEEINAYIDSKIEKQKSYEPKPTPVVKPVFQSAQSIIVDEETKTEGDTENKDIPPETPKQ
ncbi:MAG TPA: ATP-dependent zinc metalloprotease FtsH [Clostridia bacterium]|nr:ATP-dependent zinc metalloprotease FtsH [Clostridia bacterium]